MDWDAEPDFSQMIEQEEGWGNDDCIQGLDAPPEDNPDIPRGDEITLPTQLEDSADMDDSEQPEHPEAEPVAAYVEPRNRPKRRRLRQKSEKVGPWEDSVSLSPPVVSSMSDPSRSGASPENAWWSAKSEKQKNDYVYNHLRREGFRDYKRAVEKEDPPVVLPDYFSKLKREDKAEVCVHWMVQGAGQKQDLCVLEWARNNFAAKRLGGSDKAQPHRFRSKQLLFTCQGDWGLVEKPADLGLSPDPLVFTDQVKELEPVQRLWAAVQQEGFKLVTRLGAHDYAICLELCTKTWRSLQMLCVHAHVAVTSQRMMSLNGASRKVRFMGSPAHVSSEDVSRRKRATGWQTFYYVTAPKVGALYSWSTKTAYLDYPVSCEWIWTLLQSQKMDLEVARHEMVKSTKCLTRHLPNVDKVRSELVALQLRDHIAAKEKVFLEKRKPFRRIPAVDALIEILKVPMERRKFLVLDGPSRMGKTQYAMSLFGREKTLEVNAANEESPNLISFSHLRHRAILLDEAPPSMVLANRKMFQCPNAMVQLAQSKTSCHAYEVYLNDTLIIICSNSWSTSVSRSPAAEADWIRANQVLVNIIEPMWLK